MLNNITMGQYYPVDSKIHRLDPRIKLILTIVFIVIVFMAKTFLGYAVILGFVWLTARLANVPFRMLLRGLKPLRIIIILTFLLNLFFTTDNRTDVFEFQQLYLRDFHVYLGLQQGCQSRSSIAGTDVSKLSQNIEILFGNALNRHI